MFMCKPITWQDRNRGSVTGMERKMNEMKGWDADSSGSADVSKTADLILSYISHQFFLFMGSFKYSSK